MMTVRIACYARFFNASWGHQLVVDVTGGRHYEARVCVGLWIGL